MIEIIKIIRESKEEKSLLCWLWGRTIYLHTLSVTIVIASEYWGHRINPFTNTRISNAHDWMRKCSWMRKCCSRDKTENRLLNEIISN